MRILISTRTSIVFLLLLLLHSCKKEDLTKNIIGSYSGSAQQRDYSGLITNYPNCNIRIEKIDRENVKAIITPDKANTSISRSMDLKFLTQYSFNNLKQMGRGVGPHGSQAILQNDQLKFEEYEVGYLIFTFQGHRD